MSKTPYLTIQDLRQATASLKIGNGKDWHLSVYQDEFLGAMLRIVGTVPDTRDPAGARTIDLGIDSRIPPCREVQDYVAWVLHRWVELWIHEARETFWYNGQLWSDPHA